MAMSTREASLLEAIRQAFSLAHVGEFEVSLEKTAEIRRQWREYLDPTSIVELMIIEGICSSYSGDLLLASDRLRRAVFGADLIGSSDLSHLALGWLAFVQFNCGEISSSLDSILSASRYVMNARAEARFRSAVNIAVINEFCGRPEVAGKWFKCAQHIAKECRSPSPLSVLVYNMAALRVTGGLLKRSRGNLTDCNFDLDLLFVRSSLNLDSILSVSVQSHLHLLIEAQALSLNGDYRGALNLLDVFLSRDHIPSSEDLVRGKFEHCLCRRCIGLSISSAEIKSLEGLLPVLTGDDDLAIACGVLAVLCEDVGRAERAESFRSVANEHFARHSSLCAEVAVRLDADKVALNPILWIREVN
jgi:hypothetical protein